MFFRQNPHQTWYKYVMIVSLKNWINSNNLVLIFIVVYFLISIIRIENPGVNNDQLMFVNAATFNPDNFFLWKSFHGFPVMVFPYIGALKSYFYMPVFHFFGVNIWSIRLPQIILIAISWFVLYKVLILAFNKKLAILTIIFLSLDPSIIIYSKTDQGPTVLEFFLKILVVYSLFLFIHHKKAIFYFMIFPILALGIFNKLNFIWFANAFVISFVIFYWRTFYNHFKKVDKLFPYLIIGIPYFFLLKLFLKISRETTLSYRDFTDPVAISNIFQNILIFYTNLLGVINGNIFFNVIYGYNPTSLGVYFSTLVLAIIFIGIFLIIKNRLNNELLRSKLRSIPSGKFFCESFIPAASCEVFWFKNKSFYFFLVLIMLTILQLLMTKKAISAWHVLSIYPFFAVILAMGLLQYKKFIFIFLTGIMILYQIIVNVIYINSYSKPTKAIAYSASIYDLIDYAKYQREKFICLDVDICNQLLSFNQETGKYSEPFFFLDPPTYTGSFFRLMGNLKKPGEYLYISHGAANSHFPALRESFFNYLKDYGINYSKVMEFKDGGNVAFEIYKTN